MIEQARSNVYFAWSELNSFMMGRKRSPLAQYRDLVKTRKELAEALELIDTELETLKNSEE